MDESGRRTAGRSFLGERKGDTGKLPETGEKTGRCLPDRGKKRRIFRRGMDTDASGFTSRREDPAKDGGIPDLSRQEARLWFYYRATRYIDCGYEVLHMGQVHLYTANDKGMAKTTELFGMIREYAKIHGIRQLGWTGR